MPRRIEFPSYKRRMDEVRRELEAKGITQIELGAKARLPNWQIGRLLSGALPEDIEDLRRFCEAVGRPIGLFLLEDPEIKELIEFHGHGPSRGKTSRRQGRRPLASLLLALGLGGAGVFGWPLSSWGAGAALFPLNITSRERVTPRFYSDYGLLLLRRRIALWLSSCTLTPVAA